MEAQDAEKECAKTELLQELDAPNTPTESTNIVDVSDPELPKKFLCAPATSVRSERVFSSASDIVTDKQSRLLPEMTDNLVFLKENLNKI